MSKLYFPKVKHYEVSDNLIFITWPDHFQCFDYITGEAQFKIDHGFEFLKVIDNKLLLGQKENGTDILVYDLKGNLIQTIAGSFYLWMVIQDNQFLYVPGEDGKNEDLGFRIDLSTLTIVAETQHYGYPSFIKGNLGIKWGPNFMSCHDIYTGEQYWSYDLGPDNTPEIHFCYLDNDNLIVTTKGKQLFCLNIQSGKCVWQKKTNYYFYIMHPVNKNLYGLERSCILEIIDSKTGDIVLSKEFPQLKELFNDDVHSHINKIYKDGFYFRNLHGDKKFCKINIPGHEVEFVADLDIPQEPGLRLPSFPYNNCYFAFDFNLNLHVIRPLIK